MRPVRPLLAAAVAALPLLVGAGCGGDDEPTRACTKVGCGSAVTVVFEEPPPERARVRVCVADTCRTVRAAAGRVNVPLESRSARDVRVTVEIVGRRRSPAAAELRLREVRPNGPGCPPVCLTGTAFYDARTNRLLPA